jgi:hypothetical protein
VPEAPGGLGAGEGLGAGGQGAEPGGYRLGGAEVLVDELAVAILQTFLDGT